MSLGARSKDLMVWAGTFLTVVVAGCSGSSPEGGTRECAGAAEVCMVNSQFVPPTLTVPVGTTVLWRNQDALGHTVTPDDPAQWGTPGSGSDETEWMQQGDTWTYAFTAPGTYGFYCVPHAAKDADGRWQGMVGTVTVT